MLLHSKTDQMLLTLVKLKLNLMFDDLAFRFGISRTTASNIFKTWLYVFHEVLFLEFMKEVPSREKTALVCRVHLVLLQIAEW